LRQAYDYWQDQPDYYLQAMLLTGNSEEKPREWQSKVVRFNKFCMLLAAIKVKITNIAEGLVLS